jgi:hypothetical protein
MINQNKYFTGPIKIEGNGKIDSVGNNMILFTKITPRETRWGQDETPLILHWNGKEFDPAIGTPEGRRAYAFLARGNVITTRNGCYEYEENYNPRAWVLENEKLVEIPYSVNSLFLDRACFGSKIYDYSLVYFERDSACPLRGVSSKKSFLRVWDGQNLGPQIQILSGEDRYYLLCDSFVAYSIEKKDKWDLVARVIEGDRLGKEQMLSEGTDMSDIDAGDNFLAAHSTNTGNLTAWVLKDGVFTPPQTLASYPSAYSNGGLEAGGNMLAYPYSQEYEGPKSIYAYVLKE